MADIQAGAWNEGRRSAAFAPRGVRERSIFPAGPRAPALRRHYIAVVVNTPRPMAMMPPMMKTMARTTPTSGSAKLG